MRKIFEINWHTRTINITSGKYSDYLERKEKDRARQLQEYANQQEEIERLSTEAKAKKAEAIQGSKFMGTDNDKFRRGFKRDRAGKSGRAAKALEKRIEQMDVVEKLVERDTFRIILDPTKPKSSRDIALREAVCQYPDSDFRIGPISLEIAYGSRVVILGLNGSGKTTLLKTIGGELAPKEGTVSIGSSLVVGNLMQEHDNLPRQESIKSVLSSKGGLAISEVYNLAVKFGFQAEEINKEIGSLSPGGRSRLLLALFSALSVNALLLDEPTNHLDLEALDALEAAIANYEGTVVLVSHDRYLLERFRATDVYVLSNGKLEKQKNFQSYLANAERQAQRLINQL